MIVYIFIYPTFSSVFIVYLLKNALISAFIYSHIYLLMDLFFSVFISAVALVISHN